LSDNSAAPVGQPPHFHPLVGAWIVTRHADAVTVLGNPDLFSSSAAFAGSFQQLGCPADIAERLEAIVPAGTPQLVASDRPQHGLLRPLATRLFTTARIEAYRPIVRDLAQGLADDLAGPGPVDLHARFAIPFSARAVLRVLGVEADRAPAVEALAASASLLFFVQLDEAAKRRSAEALLALEEEMAVLLDARTAAPRDDLASALARANASESEPLKRAQLIQLLLDMAFAGTDPVATVLSSFMLRLLATGGAWRRAAATPETIGSVVEEAVRLASGLRGIARRAVRDTEVGGTPIEAGATVLVMPGPVNRDEGVFPDPGNVCPGRAGARTHIGFGYGIHYCVGAPLGRLDLELALTALLERFPDMRLWPSQPVAFARAPLLTQVGRLLVDPGPRRGG